MTYSIGDNFLYRYDSCAVSIGLDEYDDPYPEHRIRIILNKYPIIKRTDKGAWIQYHSYDRNKKFVLLTAKKQFASETEEKAKECFIARKKRYIRILRSRLEDAEDAIKIIEGERNGLFNWR